ncbi:MAG: aminopeptidase family protein [Devosia sp.]|uniref:M24 family metallopeptidase n=1 Tax=Devosia sp. TaxID=1871048 RepID=UPI002626AE6E|nr:Xaa-Pro peptidase family protein [Devosia sp.]MDB5588870.1 aminopeptidase family protein [Devosia sp.]
MKPSRISNDERVGRLGLLRTAMDGQGVDALLLGSTENLRYFTGLDWHPSERFCGALVTRDALTYVVPGFERSRVEGLAKVDAEIEAWEEHEDSARLIASLLGSTGQMALDEALPLSQFYRLQHVLGAERLVDGGQLVREQRLCKSAAEIALIQYAMNLTLDVQKSAHAMMQPGIRASDVVAFIDQEHRRLGSDGGSVFCAVSFGATTALPHGGDQERTLSPGDAILVDTGCRVDGYHSDITRTYVLDEPDQQFAQRWAIEREAQQAVFDAASIGATCGSLDDAARNVLARHELGPDYRLPGLPHRAGHGLGLDIHEEPFIVRGNQTRLRQGMCFSNEPMIVFPGQYGIRLEDHIYMTAEGPQWFTRPSHSPTDPFGS